MSYVRGIARTQRSMFPPALEEAIAPQSMVRVIDAFVEMLDVAQLGFDKAQPAATGRPPYDPKDLLKLYLYGYLNRVRASRALEREASRNLELMWLLNQLMPDFKTIADFRRDNALAIVGVCRSLVSFCREQKLLGGKTVAIDGSKFEALASRKQVWTGERLERTVRAIDRDIVEYLKQMDEQDAQHAGRLAVGDIPAALAALQDKRAELQALAAQLNLTGERQQVKGEPEAKLMRTAQGTSKVAYNVQIAVDEQHHLIAAHALTNQGNDHEQLEPMAKAAQAALQAPALTVIADTGYFNGQQAQACEQANITPIVPPPTYTNTTGKDLFSADRFEYERQSNTYRCPAGESLRLTRTDRAREIYYYGTNACAACALKAQCTRGRSRTIRRSFYAEARERLAQRVQSQPQMRILRSSLVEHPIGTLKHLMGTPRFVVRGLRKAGAEISLAITAYNLKRLVAVMSATTLIATLRAHAPEHA
jgi:transposase